MKKLTIFALAALVAMTWQMAQAASSAWFATEGAQLRLIAMPGADGQTVRAGLQVELDPGWKTYWRQPGASGIPPHLDFSASRNLSQITFAFPAPKVFDEADGTSVGYKRSVTFPIRAHKVNGALPASLDVNGVIGICSTICVPLPFQLSVDLEGDSGSALDVAIAMREAEMALPKKAMDGLAITASEAVGADRLIVTARVPADAEDLALLPEGPLHWYLQPAELVGRSGGEARFAITLPKDVGETRDLTLTLVADGVAVEQTIELPERKDP